MDLKHFSFLVLSPLASPTPEWLRMLALLTCPDFWDSAARGPAIGRCPGSLSGSRALYVRPPWPCGRGHSFKNYHTHRHTYTHTVILFYFVSKGARNTKISLGFRNDFFFFAMCIHVYMCIYKCIYINEYIKYIFICDI